MSNRNRVVAIATFFLGLLFLQPHRADAQLALNGTTTSQGTFAPAALTMTVAHTTPVRANRLMIVAVHMNVTTSTATTIASVTYNGAAMFLAEALTEGANDVRIELWYLLAPSTGTNNVVVTAQNVAAGQTVPSLVGVTTFVDVDQALTGSLGYTAGGNNNTPTSTLAGTAAGDLVVDYTSARHNGTLTAAVGAGQTSMYNTTSPAPLTTADVLAVASTEVSTGANVTMSYTLNANRVWAKAGGSLRGARTDVEITGYASPDLVDGSPTQVTFTWKIQAQSAGANNVNFSNPLPAGLTIVSATTTLGTCTPAATTTCAIGSLMNAGDSATVTIVATAASGGLATVYNVPASITVGTTDAIAGNNTATVVVRTQSHLCSNPGKDGIGGTITGSVNTYWPGSANAAAAATSVTVAAGTGPTAIAVGDLLLIMQMQDSLIDANNDDRYGDGAGNGSLGTAGNGSSLLNSAGRYEYVVSRSALAVAGAGAINITGAGLGGGLIYAYTNAAASGTQGARRYQVIRVPQYTSATIAAGTRALPWTGSIGGVFAMDVSGTVTMGSGAGAGTVATTNGSATVTGTGTTFTNVVHSGDTITITGEGTRTVLYINNNTQLTLTTNATTTGTNRAYTVPQLSVTGVGFRGGAGRQLAGGAGANTDYRTTAATATNASKGEGIAGTPRYLFNNTATVLDTTIDGYPNGSSGRGAPGNAGGGGTDGNPVANDENTGGGGGGNAGDGGGGGNAWNSSSATGGYGGTFEAPTTTRLVMGGGGGAGTSNNGTAAGSVILGTNAINSSGQAGGGIVLIRANELLGTGTIAANGSHALDVSNDAGGGGGAGGTVVIDTRFGSLTTLTITARGGNGGNAWLAQASPCSNPTCPPNARDFPGERHGPGGGGGGGAIYLSSSAASTDVTGGTNGLTTTDLDNFGSGPGLAGIVSTPLAVVAGAEGGYSCAVADLAVTNADAPDPVTPGSNITYTQVLTNNGPSAADQPVFTTSVPASATFVSMTPPAGWTCITPAPGGTGIITCTASTLASLATATFSAVMQAHPGTPAGYIISNTANATSRTTDSNYANNSATTTTNVVTSAYADMAVVISAPARVVANTNIAYTQTVTNYGGATAVNPTFTENTPPNTTFVSIAPQPGWTCITPAPGGTGAITCSAANLAAGASVSIGMVVKVNAGTVATTVITETATVSTTTPDSNSSNNISSASTTVVAAGSADLATTITALNDPVGPGETVTFVETVTNNGVTSTNASFTQTVPANTTFVSMTVPAGWTCVLPAVGAAAGTAIPCTTTALLTTGTTSTFSPVFQSIVGTAPGTTISQTCNIATTGGIVDSIAANNSATDTALVRGNGEADLGITKTDSPDPVGAGQLVTYLITVVNNGPEVATGVTVSDTLPANVFFIRASPSAGSCAGTTTIVCSVGTMAIRATETISIVVQTQVAGTLTNTATVSGTKTDPVAANNSSTATTTVLSVTLVRLRDFSVKQTNKNVMISWQTSFEADNLGFNIYRETGGVRTQVNEQLIAGTALLAAKHDGQSDHGYRLKDKLDSGVFAQYWLEDVDLSGVKTMHGPVSPISGYVDEPENATPLPGLGAGGSVVASPAGYGVVRTYSEDVTDKQFKTQSDLAADAGLKIYTTQEGWYRLTRATMTAAGFDPGSDARGLALYTSGIEQPLIVSDGGDGKLDATDAIEFYATPLDAISTGVRTYWLRLEKSKGGGRIDTSKTKGGDPLTGSIAFTYERKDRAVFVAAITNNGEGDNFFGPIVMPIPATQPLTVGNLDPTFGGNARLELTLQGTTHPAVHNVAVSLGGHDLGTATFADQQQQTFTFDFPQSWLAAGTNTLTLQSLGGWSDISVGASTRLTYQHLLSADDGALEATLQGGRAVTVGGFTAAGVRALDVTNSIAPIELETVVAPQGSGYAATFTPAGSGARVVLVFQPSRVLAPAELAANRPSTLSAAKGADLVIISNSAFMAAASTLQPVREREGTATVVVDVEDVYDEFGFGIRSPKAIRTFLATAAKWKTAPRYVMLVGDASIDPRNYLHSGAYDFVPTKLIATTLIKTASDDWFADFNDDGIAEMAVGRVPVRTAADAARYFAKLTGRGTPSGTWSNDAVLVADHPTDYDFAEVTTSLAALLPPTMTSSTIDFARTPTPYDDLVNAMMRGSLIVDYIGHASAEMWSEGVFGSATADNLQNGSRLPFVVSMSCLNGYFHDIYTRSLAEALIGSQNGGAIAVWASSSLTQPDQQALMNRELFRRLFAAPHVALGDAVRGAKSAASDPDVRKSWIFFGDPSMTLR
ncbi:MAG: hypothetical protein QOI24_2293 [Acidobacteriota bacterium]|jgi:uncharacterized repeat protein (TIGR01451 family)|nr:hypothetical protein [Acidobacteriota bacterium]